MLKPKQESSTTPEQQPVSFDVWEEMSEDNGEIIEFKAGTQKDGFFIQRSTVVLPEDKRQERNGELQTTANMIVFGDENEENRWSMWDNYTTSRVQFIQGDFYRVACTGERKTNQGNMKVYSIKHRVTKVEEPF